MAQQYPRCQTAGPVGQEKSNRHETEPLKLPIFDASPRAIVITFLVAVATVFLLALPAQAQTYSVLHYFTGGSDGGSPYSGVTVSPSGTLYGTTGGAGDAFGGVFQMAKKGTGWTFDPLYTFLGGRDGAYPYSGVVFGPNGALYGTTWAGGFGVGTVFSVRPPVTVCKTAICYWNETAIYSFTGNTGDGGFPAYGNVTFDQAGNIYGTTESLGAHTCGVVWKLAPSGSGWTENVLYNFPGGTDGCNPFSGVIFGGAGNLYGNTSDGGTQGVGTIYQLTPSNGTWTNRVLVQMNHATGYHPIGTLIADHAGNLYGTAENDGPNGGGTVYELKASTGFTSRWFTPLTPAPPPPA